MDLIKQMTQVREDNNRLWMGIVKVALKKAPEETKALLKCINKNDEKIYGIMVELTNE